MNARQVAERLIAARQTAAGGTSPDGARTPLEAYTDELATYTATLRTAPPETLAAVLDWYATEIALARDSVNENQARRWRLSHAGHYAPDPQPLNRDWPGRAEVLRSFGGDIDNETVDQIDAAHTEETPRG